MNLFFGATIVLVIVVVHIEALEMSSEESDERYMELIACKNETNASDMDLELMISRAIPATKEAKCLNACYLNKLGVMMNEKFVPESLIEFLSDETLIGSHGKTIYEVVKDIADDCKTVSDADKCESAAKILICLNAAARKRGFCPNVF